LRLDTESWYLVGAPEHRYILVKKGKALR